MTKQGKPSQQDSLSVRLRQLFYAFSSLASREPLVAVSAVVAVLATAFGLYSAYAITAMKLAIHQ